MGGYKNFIDEITTEYDEIWELAQEKCSGEEATIIASMIGLAGVIVYFADDELGNPAASQPDETRNKLIAYAEKHCFDYSGLENSKKALGLASRVMERDTPDLQTEISMGLATWKTTESHAADAFIGNYVTTILPRYGNLQKEFGRSDAIIDSIGAIVDENREAIRGLLDQLRERLESYQPVTLVSMRLAEVTMMGAGLTVTPIAAAGMAVGSIVVAGEMEALSGSTGRGVAGFFDAFRLGIDGLAALRKNAYDDLARKITAYQNSLDTGDFVFSRPSSYDENGQ